MKSRTKRKNDSKRKKRKAVVAGAEGRKVIKSGKKRPTSVKFLKNT